MGSNATSKGTKARLDTESVLHAAEVLIEAEGYDALTMTSLANSLGTKASTLYNHVAGLDEVRALVQNRAMSRLGVELRTTAMGTSGAEGVRALAVAYREFAHRQPQLYLAMTRTPVDRRSYWKAASDAQGALDVMVRTTGIPESKVLAAELAFFAALHGFVTLEVSGFFGDIDVTEAFEATLRGAVTSIVLSTTNPEG